MQMNKFVLHFAKQGTIYPFIFPVRCYSNSPLIDFYQKTTGEAISNHYLQKLKKQYPNIGGISHDRIQCSLQILQKFDITELDACLNVHVLIMNPITMDNYGEILKECGFIKILPENIIRYHTLVRSRTIESLKKAGSLREDLNVEEYIMNQIREWPVSQKTYYNCSDANTSILTLRKKILEKYLQWRLSVTTDEFNKYCRNYLPLKHKPMSDIQESLNIAQYDIKLDVSTIRKNGFIISADPINTKLILENVKMVAGIDIRDAIKLEPGILKNNYNSLQQIRNILEEYRISDEVQRKSLRIYCMCPKTVQNRLEELRNLKEYQVLQTNPRMLSMVVHKRKVQERLDKIYGARKQCYSINHLVSSSKVFNEYISSFGSKSCGRDMAVLIHSSLQMGRACQSSESELINQILIRLKKHKYFLHSALNIIYENIIYLKQKFNDQVIYNNCHILLYPGAEIKRYIELLKKLQKKTNELGKCDIDDNVLDTIYNNLDFRALTDDEILSLVLYEIEKKYHFSGDGMWAKTEAARADPVSGGL